MLLQPQYLVLDGRDKPSRPIQNIMAVESKLCLTETLKGKNGSEKWSLTVFEECIIIECGQHFLAACIVIQARVRTGLLVSQKPTLRK